MKLIRAEHVKPHPGAEGKFTPGVWHEEIVEAQTEKGLRMHRFSYEPGARSYWHEHEGEQAIVVLAGSGRVGKENEEVELRPGDVVYIAPGEKHWHGASPDRLFVHLAFTASGGTKWYDDAD